MPGILSLSGAGGARGNPNLAYTNKVRALGPIGYWPMGEQSGATVTDESGNARNGTYSNVTLGATGIGDGRTAATFNGTSSYADLFSTALRDAINTGEGSMAIWAKVSAAGVWTDSTFRFPFWFETNASGNFCGINRTSTNNQIQGRYRSGAATKSVTITGSPTGWTHYAWTWSASGDAFKMYLNGVQTGATQTGLGAWTGAIVRITIGAQTTVPASVWSGDMQHGVIFASALSDANVLAIATVP